MSARARATTRMRGLLANTATRWPPEELEKYERSVGHQPSRDTSGGGAVAP